MANPFVHIELHTKDVAKAKQFYGQLFGWKLQDTRHTKPKHSGREVFDR